MNTYDVIISGGGMVGAVCANALAAADLSVALVEVAPRLQSGLLPPGIFG